MSATKLNALRAKHPTLRYQSFSLQLDPGLITISYQFALAPDLVFSPTITIPTAKSTTTHITKRLAFLIGMVELISYWKLSCPERIEICCGHLTADELLWWKDLFHKGLGEFFFLNQIDPHLKFEFIVSEPPSEPCPNLPIHSSEGALVLVGGGKDSIVTLEAVRSFGLDQVMALCINPIPASLDAIKAAGYPTPLLVTRRLDPLLNKLNQEGYLNGHTPYSALLAFVSMLVAYEHNIKYTLASNETSASEGNAQIGGIEVNHQYSKSFDFEQRFREYPFDFSAPAEYLSFLRPLNELQICAIFAQHKNYHRIFRSCNREQTQKARSSMTNITEGAHGRRVGWCGECPKCVFTCISLACFLNEDEIRNIFGVSPFESPKFLDMARQLAGLGAHKPFECVGTYEEVRSALAYIADNTQGASHRYYSREDLISIAGSAPKLRSILARWDTANYLSEKMQDILRQSISRAIEGIKS